MPLSLAAANLPLNQDHPPPLKLIGSWAERSDKKIHEQCTGDLKPNWMGKICFYIASTKHDTSFEEYGHDGESATTFPMMINVGDTNSADIISSARSFSSAKTCMKCICNNNQTAMKNMKTGNVKPILCECLSVKESKGSIFHGQSGWWQSAKGK